MASHFKSPLTIYVLWHPRFTDGEKLANRLFNTLSRNVDDPFARLIGIPVFYRSQPAGTENAKPVRIPLEESEYNAIVVFVDTQMLLSKDWKEYVKEILGEMKKDAAKTRVFPMASDFHAFKSKELGAINYIRLFEADDKDDFGTIEVSNTADESVTSQLEAKLLVREANVRVREALLAEREDVLKAKEDVAGASAAAGQPSATVGQPTVQGNGININITINHPDCTAAGGQLAADAGHSTSGAPTPVSLAGIANDNTRKNIGRLEFKVIKVADAKPTSAALQSKKSAEGILQRRGNLMMSKLVHELCRLIVSPPKLTDAGTAVSARPVNLFLSHAKKDGAEIATAIKNYIEEDSSMKTFFDANDIAAGYEFSDELKGAIESSALICIQTEHYATREWCLCEVITAKRFDRPVVVLNAVMEREPRSFPYIGNVPTLRWDPKNKARFREIVDMALFEVLANEYNKMFQVAVRELYEMPPGTETVGHAPELFSILRFREKEKEQENENATDSTKRAKYILYPDPPLGDVEIQLLQDLSPDLRFITPTMLPTIKHQSNSK